MIKPPIWNRIVLPLGILAWALAVGCSKASPALQALEGDPAAVGLYFDPTQAPTPKPRPASDGFAQLQQLGKDLGELRRSGGYTGRQVAQTSREDPVAAEAMMAKLQPFVERAHKALKAPSEPYVYDPHDPDYPFLPPRGGVPLDIAFLLQADEIVNLQKSRVNEANKDIEDILKLANFVSLMPSSNALQSEPPIRAIALQPLQRFTKPYHDQPKARAELKEMIERKRKAIPVIDRIRTDAYFMVQFARTDVVKVNPSYVEPTVKGRIRAFTILANMAKPCGDNFELFQERLSEFMRKEFGPSRPRNPNPADPDVNLRSCLELYLSMSHGNSADPHAPARAQGQILAWLADEAYRDAHGKLPGT